MRADRGTGRSFHRRKSVLKGQTVKGKKKTKRTFPCLLRTLSGIGAFTLKLSVLLFILVLVSLLFLYSYEYLLTSPHLMLESVVMEGVGEDMKRELFTMSGLRFDMSLLEISLSGTREKLEKHFWVHSVELEKRFPHTLIVRVEKEIPQAVVVMDTLYYMNGTGQIFKKVDDTDGVDYPVVTGVSSADEMREKQLALAASVIGSLKSGKDPWSYGGLSEVHMTKDDMVCLYFQSLDAAIRLKGQDVTEKMNKLQKVLEHLNRTGRIHMVKAINLNYRDAAAVSFRGGARIDRKS
jgi:cell division protein FtsQ